MSFGELVVEVAKATGLPTDVVRVALRGFVHEARRVLKSGERVVLPGFGTLRPYELTPRALFAGTRASEGGHTIRFKESRRSRYGEDGRGSR